MLLRFTEDAWKDYCYWQSQDKKTLKRINSLIKEIDAENRLIYMLDESGIAFLSFKDHY